MKKHLLKKYINYFILNEDYSYNKPEDFNFKEFGLFFTRNYNNNILATLYGINERKYGIDHICSAEIFPDENRFAFTGVVSMSYMYEHMLEVEKIKFYQFTERDYSIYNEIDLKLPVVKKINIPSLFKVITYNLHKENFKLYI